LLEIHLQTESPDDIEVDIDAFKGKYRKCILYVPVGTLDAYRKHPVFGKFKKIIERE